MRDTWYSDNRDVVKWSALHSLATDNHLASIVQVLFLQAGEPPTLSFDGNPLPIPGAVWRHFRDFLAVERLAASFGCAIHVYDQLFSSRTRRAYVDELLAFLPSAKGPRLVFLDPDAGLEPGRLSGRHVALADVRRVWNFLAPGEWLAVYQHASRDRQWRERAHAAFSTACGHAHVRQFVGFRLAHDVILLAAERPDAVA